jgi:hypothetical protein
MDKTEQASEMFRCQTAAMKALFADWGFVDEPGKAGCSQLNPIPQLLAGY